MTRVIVLSDVHGNSVALEAVRGAKDYVSEAIRRSYAVGRGHGPLDQLHPLRSHRD